MTQGQSGTAVTAWASGSGRASRSEPISQSRPGSRVRFAAVLNSRVDGLSVVLALISAGLLVFGPAARVVDYVRQRNYETPEEPAWWARIFDLSTEANLPTWWASTLLAGLAAVFLVAGMLQRTAAASASSYWTLGAVALMLSIDEAAAIHEQLLGAVGDVVVDGNGLLHFTWIVPGAVVALVVGLVVLVASADLPADARRWLAVGGAVFLCGAIVTEAVSGAVLDARGHDRWYLLVTTVEEGLELAGVLIALTGARRLIRITRTPLGDHPPTTTPGTPHITVELR